MSELNRQGAKLNKGVLIEARAIGARHEHLAHCVVSDRFRFICLLIAKNASTTLRKEFGQGIYDSYEHRYRSLDQRVREIYFTFAALRDPVSRLLSAYQEISMHFESDELPNPPERGFFLMDDTAERFESFVDALDDASWDEHLLPQVYSLAGVRVDLFVRVEQLQLDIREVFSRLDNAACPTMP
ncbi:unnamed protein product, partial [marine sediment metagenome]